MVRRLKDYAVDLIVTVGFDRLFVPEVLAAARLGGINAHPSLLPELRGPSPIFWAVKSGCRELGVTLHALDRREDHGVILDQAPFRLPRRATGAEIYGIAGDLAGKMYLELLRGVVNELPLGRPQDHARATRAPRPRPEDVEVVPAEWQCERLADFACGAPYFRAPFLKLGDETFFVRCALAVELGRHPVRAHGLDARRTVQGRRGSARDPGVSAALVADARLRDGPTSSCAARTCRTEGEEAVECR